MQRDTWKGSPFFAIRIHCETDQGGMLEEGGTETVVLVEQSLSIYVDIYMHGDESETRWA